LPANPSQTDGAAGAGAGFDAGVFFFFVPANPSQTDGAAGAGASFVARFFFRGAFFVFFVCAVAPRFAFLDFFAIFNLPMVLKSAPHTAT
jgi:hypothetical protein